MENIARSTASVPVKLPFSSSFYADVAGKACAPLPNPDVDINTFQRRHTACGLQSQGMTRNESPVPLSYPPQPSGQRASLQTQLQYANPAQKNAAQLQTRTAEYATIRAPQPAQMPVAPQQTRPATLVQQEQRVQLRPSSQKFPATAREVPTASDYTSSESSKASSPRPRAQQTRSEVW